jgi:hypothetical protein
LSDARSRKADEFGSAGGAIAVLGKRVEDLVLLRASRRLSSIHVQQRSNSRLATSYTWACLLTVCRIAFVSSACLDGSLTKGAVNGLGWTLLGGVHLRLRCKSPDSGVVGVAGR